MKIYTALSHSIIMDISYYGEHLRRVLVSFFSIRLQGPRVIPVLQKAPFAGQYFLDSGAFSAFKGKEKIRLHEYIDFIQKYGDLFDIIASLDVIGDWQATSANQKELEKNGINALPVFHYNSPYNELRRLSDNYEYFALGGLVPLALKKNLLFKHLDNCFSIISKNKNKIHLFGMSSKALLENYPAFSSDSTSCYEGAIRGTVSKVSKGKRLNPKKSIKGFVMMDKKNDSIKRYKDRVKFMLDDTVVLEKYLTELWEKRGIIWEDCNGETKSN